MSSIQANWNDPFRFWHFHRHPFLYYWFGYWLGWRDKWDVECAKWYGHTP